MAEASPPPSARKSEPQNPKELKDSEAAPAAEKLMQLSGEEHENYENNSSNEKETMQREKEPDWEKKMMMMREKIPDSENDNKKTIRRKKAPDCKKMMMMMMKRYSETRNNNNSNSKAMKMKMEKAADFEKKKKVMKRVMKVPDSEDDDQSEGEVTWSTEARKEAKSFARPKKQKYRSLRDLYKATEPVSASAVVNGKNNISSDHKKPNWFFQ
ncbi:hypothetical protein RHMOL_Rhmol10G0214800 [Rhododendron molle]|uniref:Uncharacterized protein n=1 Tax=Rhododendron molle TaxID=49168 RepID=A0ACC0M4S9_RHOML|nr:hypothetical protein RHMOL_Rhmol10G0214800 [Rhododendron molle]